ncbi:hypothetical protein [Streptomyces sp. NPDC052107]|uniref:hypothetical protein n=1 Tax=Streptomyces sp. NPDC052107 TaxID=3155632 RepID=UPI00342610EF
MGAISTALRTRSGAPESPSPPGGGRLADDCLDEDRLTEERLNGDRLADHRLPEGRHIEDRPAEDRFTDAAGALALLGCSVVPAAALADPPEPPQHVAGTLIPGGADGTRHEVLCPARQHAYGGGHGLSARNGTRLSEEAADVLDNRSNENASRWIKPGGHPHGTGNKRHDAGPADLTIHLTCSDESPMHGM